MLITISDRYIFQFTPPRGGKQKTPVLSVGLESYFNSRPREGANEAKREKEKRGGISIHAPARGQTPSLCV